jgi:hypothetical protein
MYHAQEIGIWLKNHPNGVVKRYQITGLIGNDYFKSATAAIVTNGLRETGLFLCIHHIFNAHNRRRISAHHELLLEISVSCARIAK